MKKFRVLVREVHVSTMEVEAETREEAIANVQEGEGEEISLEYGHTPDDGETIRQTFETEEA